MKKSRFFIVATLAIILIIGISSCSNPSDDTKLVRDQTELEKITESKEDFATTKSYMGGSNQLDDITNENSALEQEDGMEHSSDTEGKDSRNITNTDGNQEVSSYNEKDNKIHDDEDPRKISNKELSNF
ncbi:hypothetical protein F3B05_25050, partial [Salmonella enterica subsp. enterica serovar Typhi]|nr:hypothetical protein [Salmonella enterica subsp. enterica serovar Typhi]